MNVMLSSTAAAVLGIALNTVAYDGQEGDIQPPSSSRVIPAATDTNICLNGSMCSLRSAMTSSMSQGFTARITISASFAAKALSFVVTISGSIALILSNVAWVLAVQMISPDWTSLPLASPAAIAPPMFPAPMIATFICFFIVSEIKFRHLFKKQRGFQDLSHMKGRII